MRNDTWITKAIWRVTSPIINAIQTKQKKESPNGRECESLGKIVHEGVTMYAKKQGIKVK